MYRALIAIDDNPTADVVKTAFKQSSSMTAHTVPTNRLIELAHDPDYHVAVLELDGSRRGGSELAAELRRINRDIEILALIEREQKDRFNRLKVDLGLFAYVPCPLDAFELVKRVLRLEQHLKQKYPVMS